MNYYNEFDKDAAAWLRQLIYDGQIPVGFVDERSIEDVRPSDLEGYTQCHFFAGIGGWPLALQLAGWPEGRPVWTGSCPCQPFSGAGRRGGVDDERHLWPAFRWLIDQCRPPAVLGEQVASKAGRSWLSGVQTDLQAMGYATAGADLCAAGVGAPHIRQRVWWVGYSVSEGLQGYTGHGDHWGESGRQREDAGGPAGETGGDSGLPYTGRGGCEVETQQPAQRAATDGEGQQAILTGGGSALCGESNRWANAIWIPCADGKARRIEPGIKPLADGIPRGVVPSSHPGAPGYAQNTGEARKMRLSGYGNAIVPQVAAEFIMATQEALHEKP